MTFEQARQRFLELLTEMEQEMAKESDFVSLRIVDSLTQHHDFGWVFFDRIDAPNANEYAGGGPAIIDKHTGEVFSLGSAHPAEWYINNYKRFRDTFRTE